jgi:hypothetical protein
MQSAFDELKEGLYRKKLVQLHRKKVKRLLVAWRGVIESYHFYQSQAYSVSLPSGYMDESMSDDNFAIGKATKLVTFRLQETKKQIRIRRLKNRVAKETKRWAWAGLRAATKSRKRERQGVYNGNMRCLKRVLMVWTEAWGKRSKYREKERQVKGIIEGMRRKAGLVQLKSYAQLRNASRQKYNLAVNHFTAFRITAAFQFLLCLSKKHRNQRNISHKIEHSKQKTLLSKAFRGLQHLRKAYSHYYSALQTLSKSCKSRYFSAFKTHYKRQQVFRVITQKNSKGSIQTILRVWKSLFNAKIALKNEDFVAAVRAGKDVKAWKWVQSAVLEKHRKVRGFRNLVKYRRKKQTFALKQSTLWDRFKQQNSAFAFKSWKIYTLSQIYRRTLITKRLKCAMRALFLHRCQTHYQACRSKRALITLFWAWRNRNMQTSTHHYIGYSGDQSLCKRPQLHQIFRAWSRKTQWKKRLPIWKTSKTTRFVRKFWIKMKEIKWKLTNERDQIFHLHKSLLVEMKQIFRVTRLSSLFRSRKLGLKAFQALKLEVIEARITHRSEDHSVFLYLPKDEADKIQGLLANESSIIDQHQIDLENELSMLTFELQNTPEKQIGRRPPPSALVHSSVMSGVSPEKAGRKLMESEQDVLRTYVQYRHSMRSLDRASQSPARIVTSGSGSITRQKENSSKKQGKSGSKRGYKWADSSLSDALKIDDLDDFSLP